MTPTFKDIEDNYPEYLDDELGYAWGVWEQATAADAKAHDKLLHSDLDALEEVDMASLSDLDRLAYARASRRLGDAEGELAALRLIATQPMEDRRIAYHEIFGLLVRRLARRGEHDEAEMMLDRVQSQDWCPEGATDYLRAYLGFTSDRTLGLAPFQELLAASPDDPELRFDLAEEMVEQGETALARELLRDCEEVAIRTGIEAVRVDVELLRQELPDLRESESNSDPTE